MVRDHFLNNYLSSNQILNLIVLYLSLN